MGVRKQALPGRLDGPWLLLYGHGEVWEYSQEDAKACDPLDVVAGAVLQLEAGATSPTSARPLSISKSSCRKEFATPPDTASANTIHLQWHKEQR
jgi:hypothetical protein